MSIVAIDLGASSGRIMICDYQNKKLLYNEIHRFNNYVIGSDGDETWNIERIISEIIIGLKKIKQSGYTNVESIGIDTWGVDFGLIDKTGNLLQAPFHYRNKIFVDGYQKIHGIINFSELYEKTGVQFMNFNTVYQLSKIKESFPDVYEKTNKLLLIPDLIIYYLTGNYTTEYTVASTTGLLSLKTKNWSWDIIERLSLRKDIFTEIVMPGKEKGKLLDSISQQTGLVDCKVYAIASHDTASAVLGTPLNTSEAFISCGTWSILGVVNDSSKTDKKSIENNFSNEGNYDGKIRFLKNISGFWILQEMKKDWEKDNHYIDYEHLAKIAQTSKNYNTFIDTDAEIFLHSGNMIEKINVYLEKTNQNSITSIDELSRVILESLALNYYEKCNLLEETINSEIKIIHIIGGGAKNDVFCQFTANATGKTVYAGPEEAAIIGNALMQLVALKKIKEAAIVNVIENSFNIKRFIPSGKQLWNNKIKDYQKVIASYDSEKNK